MRVREQSLLQFFVAVFTPPHLSPADKKALITCETVHDWRILALQRKLIGSVRDAHAAKVADVLAQSELAVDAVGGEWLVRVVLLTSLVVRSSNSS